MRGPDPTMDVSVIIPTHGRPRKAAACVAALARQTLSPDRFEVLVGIDGADPETERAVHEAWAAGPPQKLRVVSCARSGPNPVRNRLLPLCRGGTLVLLNDDVRPDPDLLAVHHREQRRSAESGRPAVIVGSSPWARPPADRFFDRLVRETSMVFFYDRMDDADPDRDWGYRHAWSLNLSMPTAAAAGVGGWAPVHLEYGHDDIEMVWRLQRQSRLPVLYRPQAQALHDHRLDCRDYLQREFMLGRSAWLYARRNPDFARDLLGRDITDDAELAYCRAFVDRERPAAARILTSFERLAGMPASVADGPDAATWVRIAYEQHLPLKRWMWKAGVLSAAEGRPRDVVRWPR